MTFTSELERLLREATPGKWYLLEQPWLRSDQETCILSGSPDPHVGVFICDFEDVTDGDAPVERNSWGDAELIAFLRNHGAALLAVVKAAQKAAEMIESEYCSHGDPHGPNNGKCYADFLHQALAALEKE